MRAAIVWCVGGIAVLFLGGCNEPPSSTSPATGTTAQSGAITDSAPAVTSAQTPSASTAEPQSSDRPAEDSSTTAIESARKAAAEKPTDLQAQMDYIEALQLAGRQKRQADDRSEQADKLFIESGAAARKLVGSEIKVPEELHEALATAFYNEACAHSRLKDSKSSLQALDDAFKFGFTHLQLLEHDEDLDVVRATPEFAEKRKLWEQQVREYVVQHAKKELKDGKTFPFDFSLTSVDGKPIKLADFKGKVLIVDIWGTWCPPCRAEIPSFVQLQKTYAEKGLQIVGLNQEHGDSPEEINKTIKSFMEENDMNYPCAPIDEPTLNQVPDLEGFPTTLFIDQSGKVRLKVVGLHEYVFLETIVQELLAESGTSPSA